MRIVITGCALLQIAAVPALMGAWFQGPAPFTMTRQIGVPIWLGSADMNGDGIADLVAIHSGAPLRVRGVTSIGVAVIPPEGALVVSETPFSGDIIDAAIADYTGDGNPDIVVIDRGAFGGDRLCVAIGTGAGSVGVIQCTNLPENADHVVAGDFNGDGQPDAAVTHSLTGQLSIWHGKKDGTFTAGPVAAVANPGVMAAADFNGDGVTDVAVHSRAGRVVLLTSAQKAPVQTVQTFAASPTFSDLVAGDVNRDGKLDLIGCDALGSMMAVGLGLGPVAPFLRPIVMTDMAVAPRLAQLTDLNGDSFAEIVVSTSAGLMVAQIDEEGRVSVPAGAGFAQASSTRFAVVDLNEDRLPDLITYTGTMGQALSLLTSQPSATNTVLEPLSTDAVFGQRVAVIARAVASTAPLPVAPLGSGRFTLYSGGKAVQEVVATPARVAAGSREVASARFELPLPLGANELTAKFVGGGGFDGSQSTAVRVTVRESPATIRLTTGVREVVREQGLTLQASVASPAGPAVDGVVRVLLDGVAAGDGPVVNGLAQVTIPRGLALGKVGVKLVFSAGSYLPAETAEMEFVVRGGLTAGNAATFVSPVAPDSLAVVAVPGLRQASATASVTPWPGVLGRVSAELRAAGGGTVRLGIVYVGPEQVNLYVPAGVVRGAASLHVLLDGVSVAAGAVQVAPVAPGIFTVGQGVPAALAALYSEAGLVREVPVFHCSNAECVGARLPVGEGDERLVLTVFGTGLRGAGQVTATVGEEDADVLFAGGHPVTPGMDQANIRVPRSLAGRGAVELVVWADGVAANRLRLLLE